MSQIKGVNTKPEILVRKFLFANGYRYRLHDKSLPGKPDIVLPKYNTVIQIHGCFWHGHTGCRYFIIPKTRTEWWTEKIKRNTANDSKNNDLILGMGWRLIVIWECELKKDKIESTFKSLLKKLK